MKTVLTIEDLHKTYGDINAVRGVSLSISEGEIFGLLGPNGAGKSTIINILAGLTTRDRGVVSVLDHDVTTDYMTTRRLLGIVHPETISDGFFDVETILRYQSGYYGIADNEERIATIIEKLGLVEVKNRKVFQLSGGMKRRLLIAKALVHDPVLLVLDEPTAGVDVELRHALWKYVRELNERGTTVLLTTHYIEEAEELCNRVGIINHGQMETIESTRALIDALGAKKLHVKFKIARDGMPAEFDDLQPEAYDGGRRWKFTMPPQGRSIREVLAQFEAAKLEYVDLWTEEGDLEDVFIDYTSRV